MSELCTPARRPPREGDRGVATVRSGAWYCIAMPARHARAHHRLRHDRAVVVHHLDPVAVADADLGGVAVVEPQRVEPARQRQHPDRVAVGRVDAPLTVRGDEVHLQHRALGVRRVEILEERGVELRLVGGEPLAGGEEAGVIEVEVGAAGERPPRDEPLHVERVGGVRPPVVHDPGPARAREDAPRPGGEVLERRPHSARPLGEVRERHPDLLLLLVERPPGHLAVRLGREVQHDVGRVARGRDGRVRPAAEGDGRALAQELVVQVRDRDGEPVRADALLAGEGPERAEAVGEVRVVALDDGQVGAILPRHERRSAVRPVRRAPDRPSRRACRARSRSPPRRARGRGGGPSRAR